MSDSLSKSVLDILALQEETQKTFVAQQEADRKANGPPIEVLMGLIPSRVRLSRRLLKDYLGTPENRSKLLKSIEKPIQTLLDRSEITQMMVEHFISLVTDILFHCDGTEVFDRGLQKLTWTSTTFSG